MEEELDYLNESKKNESNNEIRVENGPKPNKINHLKYRLVKTFFLFLSWISLGLFSEIIGPALPSLRVLTDSNYEEIARALSSRAIGMLTGSIIGGILADVFVTSRNFLIFIFLSMAGITVATIPCCRTLTVLSFNLFISGFSHGAFTTSGNPSLGALWKEKSTGPYNFMHSGYGLGAAVAPILISAFEVSPLPNVTIYSNFTLSKDSAAFIKSSFLIVSSYCILIAFIFLFYCFLKNPIDDSEIPFCSNCNVQNSIAIEQVAPINSQFTAFYKMKNSIKLSLSNINRKLITIMVLCFIGYFALVGNERVFGKFQFSYAIEGPLKMSKNHGYLINCLYWVSFCIARIFTALLALKISPKILLMIEICGALTSSIAFTIWKSESVFFVFSTSFGFFKSPLFPTMLGVLSLYTTISGILVVVVNFGSAAGAAGCQYLAGYLIHTYGHYTFPITVTCTALFLLIVCSFILLITRNWKKL